MYDQISFVPVIGTMNGGTEVRIGLPKKDITRLDELDCVFNGISALGIRLEEEVGEGITVVCQLASKDGFVSWYKYLSIQRALR